MNKFLKFSMIAVLVCIMFSCKDDDPKEEVITPAYVEVAITDQIQSFLGDADTKKVTLKTNREIELTLPVLDWLTVKIDSTDLKAGTASLSISVTKNTTAFKGRNAAIAIALKPLKEGDNVSASTAKATIEVKQSLFGLPIADLLDVSFTPTGPVDLSPLNNPVTDVLPHSEPLNSVRGGSFPDGYPKIYPTISKNEAYGVFTAHFSGPQDGNERGSCAYRVNFADYSAVSASNNPRLPEGPVLPLNEIGKALTKEFALECLYKRDLLTYTEEEVKYLSASNATVAGTEKLNNRSYPFSATQSFGVGLQVSGGPKDANGKGSGRLAFYTETNENGVPPQGGAGGAICQAVDETQFVEYDKYYHAIATYKYDETAKQGTLILYVNGVKVADTKTQVNWNIKMAAPNHTDALAQWFAIGGDSRKADIVKGNHFNDSFENWSERVWSGEIVIARIYGHALTAEEVSALYNFHKPE
jgi:Cu/Ag efflux protein CusF